VYGQTPTYKPSVQLDSASGLQAEWIGRSYGKLDGSRSAADEMTLTFKVKAAPELKPGDWSLTALVGYASVSRDGRILPAN
jgi:hypothetical protein